MTGLDNMIGLDFLNSAPPTKNKGKNYFWLFIIHINSCVFSLFIVFSGFNILYSEMCAWYRDVGYMDPIYPQV